MTLRFSEICIDAHDVDALAAWWSRVLGWPAERAYDDDMALRSPAGAGPDAKHKLVSLTRHKIALEEQAAKAPTEYLACPDYARRDTRCLATAGPGDGRPLFDPARPVVIVAGGCGERRRGARLGVAQAQGRTRGIRR